MVLNFGKRIFGGEKDFVNPWDTSKMFTKTQTNKDITIVNEGEAITGYTQAQAYGITTENREIGYSTTYNIKNESGASRNVTIVITNETKSTTLLDAGSADLNDGEFKSHTDFFTTEEISEGDYIRLTIGNEGIGTALASPTLAQYSFEVNSLTWTDNLT